MPATLISRFALFVAFCLGVTVVSTAAQGKVSADISVDVSVNAIESEYPLSSHLEILRDSSKKMDIDVVRSENVRSQFTKNGTGVPSFGYTDEAFWVRFRLSNPTNTPIKKVLELAHPTVNEIDLYIDSGDDSGDDNGTIDHVSSGMDRDFSTREYNYQNFLFDINIPPNKVVTVYQRTFARSSSLIPLVLWDQHALVSHITRNQYVFGMMTGMYLLLIIYSCFMYFPLKDRSYLYYIFFLASSLFYQLSVNGYAYQMLWPDSPYWGARSLAFFVYTTCATGALFTVDMLNLKKTSPKMATVFRLMLILCAVGAGAVFVIDYALVVFLSTIAGGVVTGFALGAAVYFYIKKIPHSGEYLAGWVFLVVGTIAVVLKFLGVLPATFITTYGLQIGGVLEMIVFSFALSNRINRLHKEVIEEEQRRIASDEKNALLTKTNSIISDAYDKLDKANTFIREVFGRYLTDDVVETLLSSPEGLTIGGEKREITILMSDLRGFTAMSEHMPAEDVVGVINIYLSAMTDVIVRFGGTIDEFLGDAVLAFFGAPMSKEDHAASAVACAVEMQRAMELVNASCDENGFPRLQQGIGVHTGSVVVGNIGSFKRAKYGAVGANINLASRIESVAKGGEILVSQATRDACDSAVEWKSSDEISPKGFTKQLRVFNVTGIKGNYNISLE